MVQGQTITTFVSHINKPVQIELAALGHSRFSYRVDSFGNLSNKGILCDGQFSVQICYQIQEFIIHCPHCSLTVKSVRHVSDFLTALKFYAFCTQ